MSDKVWQEFYCGNCVGYIKVRININVNCEVEVECPNCGHKHRRIFRDGVIYENGRYANEPKFELTPTKSAYSKKPWTAKMAGKPAGSYDSNRRDAAVIKEGDGRDAFSSQHFRDRWFELYGGKE